MRLHTPLQGTSEIDAPSSDATPQTEAPGHFHDRGVGWMLDEIERHTVETPDAVYHVLVRRAEKTLDDVSQPEVDPHAIARQSLAAMGCTDRLTFLETPVRRFVGRTFGSLGGIKALYRAVIGKSAPRERPLTHENMREIADVLFPATHDEEQRQRERRKEQCRDEVRRVFASFGYADWQSLAHASPHTIVHMKFGSRTGPLALYTMATGKKSIRLSSANLREIADALYPQDPRDLEQREQQERASMLEKLRGALASHGYADWSSIADATVTIFSAEHFRDVGGACSVYFLLTGKHVKTINRKRMRAMADALYPKSPEERRKLRRQKREELDHRRAHARAALRAAGFTGPASMERMMQIRGRRFEGIGSIRSLYHAVTGKYIEQNMHATRAHLEEIVNALYGRSSAIPSSLVPAAKRDGPVKPAVILDDVDFYKKTVTTGALLSDVEEREALADLTEKRERIWEALLESAFMRGCAGDVVRSVGLKDVRGVVRYVRVGCKEQPLNVLRECAELSRLLSEATDEHTFVTLLRRRPLAVPAMRRILLKARRTHVPAHGESDGQLTEHADAMQAALHSYDDARNAFARSYAPLVIGVAASCMKHRSQLPDLIGEGNIILLKEIDRFDPSAGNRFGSLAGKTIRWHLKALVHEDRGVIRIPQEEAKRLDYIRLLRLQLHHTLGYAPVLEEAARAKGLSKEECGNLLRADRCTDVQPHFDLFDSVADVRTTEDGQAEAIDPVARTTALERNDAIKSLLGECAEDLRAVVELRYGLNGYAGRTHSHPQIAALLGMSVDRVSKLEQDGLKTIVESAKRLRVPLLDYYKESVS